MHLTESYEHPGILPPDVRSRWEFLETGSAAAVMHAVCPEEWADIVHVLRTFALDPPFWLKAGGNRGDVAEAIDNLFAQRGWSERRLDLHTVGVLYAKNNAEVARLPGIHQEGYLVDNFKGRVVLDVEWNAKDGNLDRDLSAYRAWHEAGLISAAVLITQDRLPLKGLAQELWGNYQRSLPVEEQDFKLPIDLNTSTTTNLQKAALRVKRGVMGTCPLLVVAATRATWNGQPFSIPATI
jgi:hypothetical protein